MSVNNRIEKAKSLYSNNKCNKADKKRAIEQINYAYDELKEEIKDNLLKMGGSECMNLRLDPEWRDLYFMMPSYVHSWKDVHTSKYSKLSSNIIVIECLKKLKESIKLGKIVQESIKSRGYNMTDDQLDVLCNNTYCTECGENPTKVPEYTGSENWYEGECERCDNLKAEFVFDMETPEQKACVPTNQTIGEIK